MPSRVAARSATTQIFAESKPCVSNAVRTSVVSFAASIFGYSDAAG